MHLPHWPEGVDVATQLTSDGGARLHAVLRYHAIADLPAQDVTADDTAVSLALADAADRAVKTLIEGLFEMLEPFEHFRKRRQSVTP